MKRLCHILVFVLLAAACSSTKKTTEAEKEVRTDTIEKVIRKIDTVYRDRTVYVDRPVNGGVILKKPCDSTGLRPFLFDFGSGGHGATLQSKDGKLTMKFHLDSLRSSIEKEYRAKYRKDSLALKKTFKKETHKEIRKKTTVWPWWLFVLIVVAGASLCTNLLQRLRIKKKNK